jgi:nascent polypeptide-associated complex subunit alpha
VALHNQYKNLRDDNKMFPGINQRQMKQAMKKLGMQQENIDAKEVIIRTGQKEIVFENPDVQKVNMGGQVTYQITGETYEKSIDSTPEIDEDDIKTVMEQADVSEEKAIKAIKEAKGDLAQAIINLS